MAARSRGLSRRAFLSSGTLAPVVAAAQGRAPAEPSAREGAEYNAIKAEFEEYGYVVLHKVIPRADAERTEKRVREIMARQPDANNIDQHLPGFFNHLDPKDDDLFLPLVTQPICLRLAQDFLGPGFQMTEVGCRWRK